MKLTLLYYGILRDIAGREREEIECSKSCTVSELKKSLVERFPAYRAIIERSILVVNNKALKSDEVLDDGNAVIVLPPGSGG